MLPTDPQMLPPRRCGIWPEAMDPNTPHDQLGSIEREQTVTVALIHARTRDEHVHTGSLTRPFAEARPLALLWIHGGGQNFAYPTTSLVGRLCRDSRFDLVQRQSHDMAAPTLHDSAGQRITMRCLRLSASEQMATLRMEKGRSRGAHSMHRTVAECRGSVCCAAASPG